MDILAVIGSILLVFGITAATIDDMIQDGKW